MATDILAIALRVLQDAGLPAYPRVTLDPSLPFIRVQRAGGVSPASDQPNHLYERDLDVTVWGSSDPEVGSTVGAVLDALHARAHTNPVVPGLGVMTRVEPLGEFDEPDPEWPVDGQPAPRTEITVRIWAHG